MKYQESAGTKLANLFSTDLAKRRHCGRHPCPPCDIISGKTRPNCRNKNILYESLCSTCNPTESVTSHEENGKGDPNNKADIRRDGVYLGETSRSLHERILDHLKDG